MTAKQDREAETRAARDIAERCWSTLKRLHPTQQDTSGWEWRMYHETRSLLFRHPWTTVGAGPVDVSAEGHLTLYGVRVVACSDNPHQLELVIPA